MKNKSCLKPLWSDKEVDRFFSYFVDRAEEKIYTLLERAGEEFVRYARKNGSYKDRTGNLRSSIGYIIAKDGDIITENHDAAAKGTDKKTGIEEARRLEREILSIYDEGWVLIGVAGMKYAAFVESLYNLDVVTGATEHTEEWLRKTSKMLFDKLAKKGY